MAESRDLLKLDEATTVEPTDQFYTRRGGLDYRISRLTLFGGYAAADHTHPNASASNSGFMSSTDKQKLDSINPNATNYTLPTASADTKGGVKIGNHLAIDQNDRLYISSLPAISSDDLTDFAEATRDVVGGMATGTGTVTVTYGVNGVLTIHGNTSPTPTTLQIPDFTEGVQDVVGGMVEGTGTVSVTYDDTTGKLSINGAVSTGGGGATTTGQITDYVESTQDLIGSTIEVTAPLTKNYDDPAGRLRLGFDMPIASEETLGAIRFDPAHFTVSPTGVLALIQAGGGNSSASALPRLVMVEDPQFGGNLGAGKTPAQRIANTAAFNACRAYCSQNKFAMFITPGTWELEAPADPNLPQHIIHDNGSSDSAVHVFGHRSVIRQHSVGKSIWEMRGKGGSLSGVTLTYAATQTTGDLPQDAGKLKTITVTAGGTGYTSAPTVTITNTGTGAPVAAAASATISGGAVTSITITSRGSGYTTPPQITLTGGGGSGATARAEIYNPHAALVMNGASDCSVRNVRTEYAWTGLHAPLFAVSSNNTIDTLTVASPNGYGIAWSNGTGNAWNNVTVTGEGASPPVACTAGLWLQNHGNSSFSKLGLESIAPQHAIRLTGSRGAVFNGVSLDMIRPRVFSSTDRITGLVNMDADSSATINGLTINGTDLNTADTANRPNKLHLFAYRNGARADVSGLRVTNTRNKAASGQEIALIGPQDTDPQSHRGVRFAFRSAVPDRSATTPHLIDRLSAHVIDTSGEDRQAGLTEFNSAIGGQIGYSAEWGNADATIYADVHGQYQAFGVPLTAHRTVIISDRIAPPYGSSGQYLSPLASRGFRQTIVRLPSCTGAFNLIVKGPDGTTLATLGAPGDRADTLYDGAKLLLEDSAIQLSGTPGSLMGFDTTGAAAVVPNTRAIAIPVTAETGLVTAGATKYRFHQPFPFRITGIMGGVNKASTSGSVIFDVLVNGVSILGTKITIPQGAETSNAGSASTTTIAAAAAVSVNCDGAGTGAEGGKVYLIGYPI